MMPDTSFSIELLNEEQKIMWYTGRKNNMALCVCMIVFIYAYKESLTLSISCKFMQCFLHFKLKLFPHKFKCTFSEIILYLCRTYLLKCDYLVNSNVSSVPDSGRVVTCGKERVNAVRNVVLLFNQTT